MSAIRMVHPQHGATHAYDSGEVAKLKGFGWQVETSEELQAEAATAQGVPTLTEAEAAQLPAHILPSAVTPIRRKPRAVK